MEDRKVGDRANARSPSSFAGLARPTQDSPTEKISTWKRAEQVGFRLGACMPDTPLAREVSLEQLGKTRVGSLVAARLLDGAQSLQESLVHIHAK